MKKLELMVMAHRYLYYVQALPVLTDFEYDKLEAKARRVLPEHSPVHSVGSSLEDSYSQEVVQYAAILFGNHVNDQS
jgi:NAD-dependent DNA ligase